LGNGGGSTTVGGVVGFILAAVLIGLFAVSDGVSEDLYAPVLVMGVLICSRIQKT
jgi:hypothetical protein